MPCLPRFFAESLPGYKNRFRVQIEKRKQSMNFPVLLWSVLVLTISPIAAALEPKECLKLEVAAGGDATVTNICSDVLNIQYCVDNADSAKSCARASFPVVVFQYGASDLIPSYVSLGKPPVYSAICVYPEAPVGWKPERDSAYTCKKTCVMC